jgi:hypothetical protein
MPFKIVFTLSIFFSAVAMARDPYLVAETISRSGRAVPLYSHIASENVEKIFAYRLEKYGIIPTYGAKAVALWLAGEEPTIYFFPIGDEKQNYQIHHQQILHFGELQQLGHIEFDSSPRTIERSQGFQLQARKYNGLWRIIGFQIDSSITIDQILGAQVSPSRQLQDQLLNKTLARIESALIAFSYPVWPRKIRWRDCVDLLAEDSRARPLSN